MATQSPSSVDTIDLLMRRVASVCDKHRVASGMPTDLTDFLVELEHNKLLAMDFWAVLGGMNSTHPGTPAVDVSSQRKSVSAPGEEMQERVLEAIVRVLTGLGVSEMISAGDQSRQAIEDLKALMGGKDMQSKPVEIAGAKADAAEPVNGWASGYKYQNIPGMRSSQSKPNQPLTGEPQQEKAKTEDRAFGFASESPKGFETANVEDGKGRPNDSVWANILSTDWAAADLRDTEQKKRAASAYRVPPIYDRELRRVLLQEETAKFSEAAGSTESAVMQPIKVAVSWMERRGLVRMVASALVMVLASILIIRLQETGALRSFGASIREMSSGFGTTENIPSSSAIAAKSGKQPTKPRGVSAGHQQKAHPAKSSDGSTDAAAKPESTATAETEGDSNGVAEKQSGAPDTTAAAPFGSSGAHGTTKTSPIEVSAEVMKANLITPAGPNSAFATGLGQGNSRVVMQVVISKLGVVEGLRVMEGDAALRAAATRAVSAWRYHPYLVNGAPVAVRTTVTVNFKMDS